MWPGATAEQEVLFARVTASGKVRQIRPSPLLMHLSRGSYNKVRPPILLVGRPRPLPVRSRVGGSAVIGYRTGTSLFSTEKLRLTQRCHAY